MIDSRQQALRERLESFVIGTGNEPMGFTQRLARENAWSRDHSTRVVREYFRFIFLCAEAGHPCTPSDAVDQAWHLHLCYTWSYWNELTPLLRKPIHHGPTKGGADEDAKHHDWYAKTLASYRRMFGEEPPKDIWPATFEAEEETVRLSRRHFWLIPRRSLRTATLSALGLAAGGCAIEGAELPVVLIIMAIVAVLVVSAIRADRRRGRRGGNDDSGSGCTGVMFIGGGCTTVVTGCGAAPSGDGGGGDSGGGDSGGGSGCSSGCGGGCGGGGD